MIHCNDSWESSLVLYTSREDFFAKYNLPTAAYRNFKSGEHEAALKYVEDEYAAGREVGALLNSGLLRVQMP